MRGAEEANITNDRKSSIFARYIASGGPLPRIDFPPPDEGVSAQERAALEARSRAAKAGPRKARAKRAEPERVGALREAVVAYGPRFKRRWMP